MEDLSWCGNWDTCHLPFCGPAIPRVSGKESIWRRHPQFLKCLRLEVTQIISTRMNILVPYWCLKSHLKCSGLQKWQHLFCSWIYNPAGLVETAYFSSIGISWASSLARDCSCWTVQLSMSEVRVAGVSEVTVHRTSILGFSMRLLGCHMA